MRNKYQMNIIMKFLLLLLLPICKCQQKLLASKGFGSAVSISDKYAIVGNPYTNSSCGEAYIYMNTGNDWIDVKELSLSDCVISSHMIGDKFGQSVSISGEYVIVGAPYKNSSRGAAYIYMKTSSDWIKMKKFVASDGVINDHFGNSVSISGEHAIIGIYNNYSGRSAAYIYMKTSTDWIEVKKLLASDSTSYDCFGQSVSISGEYAIVGAYMKDSSRGASYIYMNISNDWIEVKKLVASDGVSGDGFGKSVSISGEYALVGAYYKDAQRGAAYIYMHISNDWIEVKKLVASDGAGQGWFGLSVSIYGEYAIVGAPTKDYPRGAAYIYMNTSNDWIEVQKLLSFDALVNNVGWSVSISDEYAIVGVPIISADFGASYLYHKCSAGLQMDGINCTECLPGTYSPFEYSIDCLACPAGSYCPNNATAIPQNCTAGTYSTEKGRSTDCPNPCPAGSYCPTPATIHYCPAGSYCPQSSTSPTTCSPGTYSTELNRSTDCPNPCPAGSYCPTPATIHYCPAGSYCPQSSTSPTTCSPGTYSTELNRSTDCPACPAGSYCPTPATIHYCPAGSYCPLSSTSPITCTSGTYSTELNRSTDCPACPAGSYCPTPIIIHNCPAGSYCIQSSTSPINCSLHSYCPSNSSSENPCPAGYYCINPSNIAKCPAGRDCEEGSINPNKTCPAGYYCAYGKPKQACVTNGYYCDEGSSSEKPCSTSCPPSAPVIVSKCTHKSNLLCSKSVNGSTSIPWTLVGIASGFAIIVLVVAISKYTGICVLHKRNNNNYNNGNDNNDGAEISYTELIDNTEDSVNRVGSELEVDLRRLNAMETS